MHELVEEVTEKDDALEELQLWKDQITRFASVGPAAAPAKRKAKEKTSTQTSARHMPRKSQVVVRSPIHASVSAEGITNTAMEDVADASFTSDASDREGSTPKRPRPRRSFKVSAMHTPYNNKTELVHKAASRNSHLPKRPALRTVSPNRRHTTVGFAAIGNEQKNGQAEENKRRGSLDLEGQAQSSFDADKYFGSTPFTPGRFECSTQKPPEDEGAEEQTTEL